MLGVWVVCDDVYLDIGVVVDIDFIDFVGVDSCERWGVGGAAEVDGRATLG